MDYCVTFQAVLVTIVIDISVYCIGIYTKVTNT